MKRKCLAGLLMTLGGCSTVPDWVPSMLRGDQSATVEASQYQFHWSLSGDRSVSPLQVFDDGKRTWLQFAAGQAVPAVFRAQGSGEVPVGYTVQHPYVVLPGVWPRLSFRGGALKGLAVRGTKEAAERTLADVRSEPAAAPGPDGEPGSPPSAASAFAVSVKPAARVDSLKSEESPARLSGVSMSETVSYDVGPADGTLRAALSRWARASGWTFQPEHWAVDVDIPINGSASFPGGFTHAVESLVAATELSDRPLQPCFYANQVLRVVPYAQPCDRSAGSLPRAS